MDQPASFYDAAPFVPATSNFEELERAVDNCRGCPLYAGATQGVFGEGPRKARILLIGEQPGDKEDLQGKPFVGPAGRVLDKALAEAGIDRSQVFLTNAVKHFKWTPSGERRLHAKPNRREVQACRPWLEKEVSVVKPDVAVCLGATAALSVFGHDVKIGESRGRLIAGLWIAPAVMVTIHPSAVLRVPDADREAALKGLVSDLLIAAESVKQASL